MPKTPDCNLQRFAQIRGQVAYVASATRPGVACICAKLSQVKADEATKEGILLLKQAIKGCKMFPQSIKIPKLDL